MTFGEVLGTQVPSIGTRTDERGHHVEPDRDGPENVLCIAAQGASDENRGHSADGKERKTPHGSTLGDVSPRNPIVQKQSENADSDIRTGEPERVAMKRRWNSDGQKKRDAGRDERCDLNAWVGRVGGVEGPGELRPAPPDQP